MWIEDDFRDLKTTLGLKRLRPRMDVELRVRYLLLVVMVTGCVAACLYPRAVAEWMRVVKRQSDVSFVGLVVMVYQLRWSRYVSGVGWESGPYRRLSNSHGSNRHQEPRGHSSLLAEAYVLRSRLPTSWLAAVTRELIKPGSSTCRIRIHTMWG
jgi:hypothetical protein